MATHSSTVAWRIQAILYSPRDCKESDTTEHLSLLLSGNKVSSPSHTTRRAKESGPEPIFYACKLWEVRLPSIRSDEPSPDTCLL